jgi:large subunit ribosomal protein L15
MATRLRKSRRQRGTRYCGWGQIGQHRASGSRGGVGGAGKHKHFWIRTVIEEPDHFGHPSSKSYSRNDVKKWANLRDLSSLITSNKGVEKESTVELNLSSLGINKLLGRGTVDRTLIIRVASVSENARTKIESNGGKIILDEHSTH